MNKPILKVNTNRIELDEAYMQMAEVWSKRSKATRAQVGALIVKDGQIISDGYNGMPAGAEGEDDVCEMYDEDGNVRTKQEVLHAEANAILKLAANGGVSSRGATLYTTYSPCPECAKLIVQAKISRVVYRKHYRLPEGVERLEKRGVKCHQLVQDGSHGEVEVPPVFGPVQPEAFPDFGRRDDQR
jgi:dCMP deaminase